MVGRHEWRHESEPTHRPSYFPRPEDERQIIRRKSFTLPTSTVDEAALQMDLLDYDFTCSKGTNTDSVLYRAGPTGYPLAQVNPASAEQRAAFELPVTVNPLPAPRLTV